MILIENMEMPTNCFDCFLMRHMHCSITYDLIPLAKRLGNCPLHEDTDSDTISRPQWIPCSERLPEVTVLCCDTRGEMIIGYPYQDEESNTGYSAVLDDIVMIDCTAWMPLPEPYQGN